MTQIPVLSSWRSRYSATVCVKATLFCLLGLLSGLVSAAPTLIPSPPAISASSYILMDANSGKVIVEQNADERLPPASLTKLMTSYVLSYELAQGNVSDDDEVLVSKKAWAQNFPGSSLMWIEVGKKVRLEDLHKGIIVSSGNDACVAVAEHVAGSEEAFADVMNQHAELLGMKNTHFVNSHGLPHKDHYSSARDLALLSRAIVDDFPKDYALYAQKEFTYNNITTQNRNTLLWRDPSVDGLKTGHTQAAGYCLVASALKNGMRLISVVMGTSSEEARLRETQKLLSYGFRYYETHKLYNAGDVLTSTKVWAGMQDTVSLAIVKDLWLTIPQGQKDALQAEMQLPLEIKAPIEQGQRLGSVIVSLDGETLADVPLAATEAVEQAGLVKRLWHELYLRAMQWLEF